MNTEDVEIEPAQHEELQALQGHLGRIDDAVAAAQSLLASSVYAKRDALARKIDHFWALVLESVPPEIDTLIQPSDSQVFASCLKAISVDRFDIPKGANPADIKNVVDGTKPDAFGEPRSFSIKFEFAENEWFEDRVLEKKFYHRQTKDGWFGKVSEPVKINWKKGKDLSQGLTDGALTLFQAQKKAGVTDDEEKAKELPQYKALEKSVESSMEGSQSFFNFFGYRGRWVSEAESKEAIAEEQEKLANGQADGAKDNDDEDDDDDDEDLDEPGMATEIFPAGEELAVAIAEDIYPNAIQFFYDSQMEGADFDIDDLDDDDDDEDMEDIEEGAVDNLSEIKNLPKRKGAEPSHKKRKSSS